MNTYGEGELAVPPPNTLTPGKTRQITKLDFQFFFKEGEDQLSSRDLPKLNYLSDFLKKHPSFLLRLDGHTDLRGTDEYNNVLSRERAIYISEALIARGIDPMRIHSFYHGASFAIFAENEAPYERRVEVEVYEEVER